jgi:hypothetical protein
MKPVLQCHPSDEQCGVERTYTPTCKCISDRSDITNLLRSGKSLGFEIAGLDWLGWGAGEIIVTRRIHW